MLVFFIQHIENFSSELETALWSLAEQASLTSEEQKRLFILLMEHTDVLILNNNGLGRTNILQHEMHTGDYPLISIECVLRRGRK